MLTDTVQRFTEGVETRRPAGESIRPSEYEVIRIPGAVAKAFVRKHHYAGECSPPAHPFGLFHRGDHVGTAVFGPMPSTNAHNKVFPTLTQKTAVTLGRFVLVDRVPGNGESWFIARAFELLREDGVIGVESCADPLRGHVGTIYQATNGRYIGRTNRAMRYVLPDGTELSNRAKSKATTGERGAERGIAQLVAFGAVPPASGEPIKAWMAYWRPRITRKFHHPGNHRYVWCLDKRHRRDVLAAPQLDYPKLAA